MNTSANANSTTVRHEVMPLRRMFGITRTLAVAALGLALAGVSQAQSYRETYPLTDPTSLDNLSLNLNLFDPSEAQIQQIADAGFKFVRYDLTWESVEKRKGVFDWSAPDRLMARAKARGMRVMFLLAFGHPLYTADTGAPNTPASRAAFARYAAAAVQRYKGQGAIWEIFNEPNLAGWWRNPNPLDYAALVNETADAIRAVAPEEWIVGLTTEILSSNNRTYIDTFLSSGALAKLDGIGFHPYTDLGPESLAAQWAEARNMIEAKRPANHPVALMAGEVGYSRSWNGIDADTQAKLTVRTVLYNLSQGIGFTNLYSYYDTAGDNEWHANCGMTSRSGNTPYPVYYAIQNLTRELDGYQFSKRLNLARADDYCLLFSKRNDPSDCKLVLWTSGDSHTINVPSSQVTFTKRTLTATAESRSPSRSELTSRVTATSAGLATLNTSEPTVYDCDGPNPLLNIAASWTKVPATVTLSDRANAVAQLGAIVASPAWAGMPAGATLTIEDAGATVPGYVRPTFTATLDNLPAMRINSPEVQAVFNSLVSLQDATDRGRILKFTVGLPDGTSVTQSTVVNRKQPMSVFATTPQNWVLTLRAENPSGEPYSGRLEAKSGAQVETVPIRFGRGETYKMVMFPTLNSALIGNEVKYRLYDNGGNAVSPNDPTIESDLQTVYRTPNFVAASGYSVRMDGPSNVAGSAGFAYGTTDWSFLGGGATGDITYAFGSGGSKWLTMPAPAAISSTTFAKTPLSIGMWVNGDGSRNWIRAQFVDASGQTFQVSYGAVDWVGWKWVSIPVAGNLTQFWGGAKDGVVHGAMRCTVPFIFDSNQKGTSGRIQLSGMTIVGQK